MMLELDTNLLLSPVHATYCKCMWFETCGIDDTMPCYGLLKHHFRFQIPWKEVECVGTLTQLSLYLTSLSLGRSYHLQGHFPIHAHPTGKSYFVFKHFQTLKIHMSFVKWFFNLRDSNPDNWRSARILHLKPVPVVLRCYHETGNGDLAGTVMNYKW